MKTKKTKIIAPKLYDKSVRLKVHLAIPESVRYGLFNIAKGENKSVSWTIESVIYDYFGIKQPRFIRSRAK